MTSLAQTAVKASERFQVRLASKPDTWRQTCEGTFDCYLRPGTPHCGPQSSPMPVKQTFRYSVELAFSDLLDRVNGFLLDNTYFAEYFASFKHVQVGVSCEHLALQIANDFTAQCNPHVRTCCVRLQPLQGVWVEVRKEL